MPAYHTRALGPISYSAGQKMSLELQRPGVLTQLDLHLTYTVTADDDTDVAAPLFQTIARLIRNVDLQLGGQDTVFSISGEMAAARATYEFGAVPQGMADSVVLTKNVGTTYDVVIPIARFLPRSRRPDDCGDDLTKVTQAILSVTWGAANGSDLFGTPNDETAISAVSLNVYGHFLIYGAGETKPNFMVRDLRTIVAQPTASNTSLKTIIDGRSGYWLKSIALATLDDKVGSNSILNSFSLETGTYSHHSRISGKVLRGRNKLLYGVESLITGFYMLDATMIGELTQAINTDPNAVRADLEMVQDITYAATVTDLVYSIESVRPLRLNG